MFDTATLELMSRARALEGLDLEALPRFLTEAYAQVIAARLRIAAGGEATLGRGWAELERMLGKVASTYEVVTLALPDGNQHREATAFVAASAHHARTRASAVVSPAWAASAGVGRAFLRPDVSAALLYSIGGHQADAGEVGRTFLVEEPGSIDLVVQNAVAKLTIATGESLKFLCGMRPVNLSTHGPAEQLAYEQLLLHALRGITSTAGRLLGITSDDPQIHYDRVIQATTDGHPKGQFNTPGWLGFKAPGVRQLVLLLEAASRTMTQSAVVKLPAPSGLEHEAWTAFLLEYAQHRPLLWRNHLAALASGLLEPGRSAVMSFPTGAGKSSLAELRAAAAHLRGQKTIYLAPTKALVAQVRRQLDGVLRPLGHVRVRSYLGDDTPEVAGFDVAVMTPEACLVLALAEPSAIADTGLIIFDECHLLSGTPAGSGRLPSRRAVDANLALLEVLKESETADVILISAMVANADALAGWIASVTGRPCSAQTDAWKPTRQIRGVLAYNRSELDSLEQTANSDWAAAQRTASESGKKPPKTPGVAIKRKMLAKPWGVFCHKQAWDVTTSFKSLPMLDRSVPLSLATNNRGIYLTPNRNVVAGQLAAAFVSAGLRPLVFVQDIPGTGAVADALVKELGEEHRTPLALDEELTNLAAAELGDTSSIIGLIGGIVGCHHALLLPCERDAIEQAYRTEVGVVALAATPTLAQGMNLPAQVVIIAGDNRWEADDEGGHPETLPVHEILNAAGRAGRAGMFAQGVVFLTPGRVLSIHQENRRIIFDGLEHAAALLGSPDQCLVVEDPLERIMDLAAEDGELPDVVNYTLRRLHSATDDGTASGADVLRSTLGYHLAREGGLVEQFDRRVHATLARASELAQGEAPSVFDELARSLGASPSDLLQTVGALPADSELAQYSIIDWAVWLTEYLTEHPTHLGLLMHFQASGLLRIFKEGKEEAWSARCSRVAAGLSLALPLWLDGSPLSKLEPKLMKHSGRVRGSAKLGLARRFHNETGSALGGAGYLIRRLVAIRADAGGRQVPDSIHLEALPGCLARGFDSPLKLALHQVMEAQGRTTRVVVHDRYADIQNQVHDHASPVDMRDARKLMSKLLAGSPQ